MKELAGSSGLSKACTSAFVKVSNSQYGLDQSINTSYYTHTNNEYTITVDSNGYYIISSNDRLLSKTNT